MSEPVGALVSVVCPVYNEEDVVEEFHDRTSRALATIEPAVRHELIYVDDGSTDNTLMVLRKLAADDESIRIIVLSRNFGHQIAITSGVDHAAGDAVVVIDADLQDPPEVITEMVSRWREGCKVVYGVRSRRRGESPLKRVTAKLFYRLLNRWADMRLPADTGDFRLMDRQVVDVLKDIREENRYFRGLVSWIGFTQCGVEYEREGRYAGESKYTVRKMLRFAADGITSFSERPLRLSTQVGALITLVSTVMTVFIVIGKILDPQRSVPGYTSLMCVVLFFGGVQLLSIGLMGEYVGRIYRESKRRPLYVVAEKLNVPDADSSA